MVQMLEYLLCKDSTSITSTLLYIITSLHGCMSQPYTTTYVYNICERSSTPDYFFVF